MPKTILSDLGGILVNLHWNKVCNPLIERSDRMADYVRRQIINGPIVQSSMKGQLAPSEFYEALCADLRIDTSYADFVGIWIRLLSANEEIVPLVDRLKDKHRLVLVSNTDRIHFMYSQGHFDVLRVFDQYFLSYAIGLLKPDPEFFLQVLGNLEAAPVDCVFIDDVVENVESTRSLGIPALQFQGNAELQAALDAVL